MGRDWGGGQETSVRGGLEHTTERARFLRREVERDQIKETT